jgi:hypothetical protein
MPVAGGLADRLNPSGTWHFLRERRAGEQSVLLIAMLNCVDGVKISSG